MLELKNIRFDVLEGHEEIGIIQDVSFTIPDNKFVVVTGPNGGGKSTLARLIAGIEERISPINRSLTARAWEFPMLCSSPSASRASRSWIS